MAIKPLERIVANAERFVRLMKPPLVSITNCMVSSKALTASNEVMASSLGMGNN